MLLIQMIIIQIITFAGLVYILRKLMYTEASKELKRLKQLNQESAKKAEELTGKIKEAQRKYQEKLSLAEDEAGNLKIKAKEDAGKLKEEILEKARQSSERIVKAAFNAKDKMRKEVSLEMQNKAPILTAKIFKETIFPEAQRITHSELVKEAVKEIKKMDKKRFNLRIKEGDIILAYSFEGDEREKIFSAVFEKLGQRIPFKEKEDKTLIAGLIIKLDTLVIDASLSNRLKRAGEQIGGLMG